MYTEFAEATPAPLVMSLQKQFVRSAWAFACARACTCAFVCACASTSTCECVCVCVFQQEMANVTHSSLPTRYHSCL